MTTRCDVCVHDIFQDGEHAVTGQPLFAALLVAQPDDSSTPLAFHTGLIGDEYLAKMRSLQAAGTVSLQLEDAFFDADLYHQRKEIIARAFDGAGIR